MFLNKQFLFIIGAPRSGTTWLQGMLGAHPAICTFAELKLYDSYTAPWIKAWQTETNLQKDGIFTGLPTIWSETEFHKFLQGFLSRVYERVLADKPAASILLDKYPGYGYHVEDINKLIPNAKFIHLIRDGRDVVTSLLAASQGEWGQQWAPKNIQQATSSWKGNVLAAQEARQYGNRYLEVRYESLLKEGVKVLESIFEFIGLPISSEEVALILDKYQFERVKQKKELISGFPLPEGFIRKGQVGDWQNALSPIQKYVFHRKAGDLLYELGYADDIWWVQHEYQRYTLPLWSMVNLALSESQSRIIPAARSILSS